MKILSLAILKAALGFLLVATGMAVIASGSAHAAKLAGADACRLYGFPPHTRGYAICRMNVRHYWTSGPCGNNFFASTHPDYCHLYPPHDF